MPRPPTYSDGAVQRAAGAPVLFVTPVTPAPTGNGLAMRAELFRAGLSRSHRVETIVAEPHGAPPDDLRALFLDARHRERIKALHPRPSLSSRATVALAERVAERAGGFSLVHVMRLYLAPALDVLLERDPTSRPRLTLDLDDLDADFFESVGEAEEGAAFRRMESYYLPRLDGACVAAEGERRELAARSGLERLTTIANAVVPPPSLIEAKRRHDLLFVGNLSYAPNIDAACWLCREILPLLPGTSVAIAGSAPAPAVRDLAGLAGVSVIGDPSEIAPLYAEARIVVAPLRIGAGTPIKVLEALAHGRALVATPKAASDLPTGLVELAQEPGDFAERCATLLADGKRRGELERRGRSYVLAERSVSVVSDLIDRWASNILAA